MIAKGSIPDLQYSFPTKKKVIAQVYLVSVLIFHFLSCGKLSYLSEACAPSFLNIPYTD